MINTIASNFGIPVLENTVGIWFVRTKAGRYYQDFTINNYIGLAWNEVSPKLISKNCDYELTKELISNLYIDEKRPGLILSQLYNFYHEIKLGDYVVIPSENSTFLSIGIIGEVIESISRIDGDYNQYNCVHMRKVKWIKTIHNDKDIYLSKLIRAQQTVTNLTCHRDIIFRNLYSLYIRDNKLHFTLVKDTEKDISLTENYTFLSSFFDIIKSFSQLYGEEIDHDAITIKTAIGSPGFIEIIAEIANSIALTAAILVSKSAIGKEKEADGITKTGIIALISAINECLNDRAQRAKVRAEIKVVEAKANKINAKADLIRANANKVNAEAKTIENQLNTKPDILQVYDDTETPQITRGENKNIITVKSLNSTVEQPDAESVSSIENHTDEIASEITTKAEAFKEIVQKCDLHIDDSQTA